MSLPTGFGRAVAGNSAKASSTTNGISRDNPAAGDSSTTNMTQKEYYVENIWRAVSKIHDMQSQRNYETVVHKRTIGEIEAFESKVEKWMNEYREFVDDGVSRKQPRF